MSDTPFRSLASETSDPLARQLLESARADGSERGARDRALLALGLAPVGLLTAALPAAASAPAAPIGTAVAGSGKGALLLLGKSLAIGIVGSLIVVGVVDVRRGEQARPPARKVAVPLTKATPTPRPKGLTLPEQTAEPQTVGRATAAPPPTPRARSLDPRETESRTEASSQTASDLAQGPSVARHADATAQLAALAGVRSALGAHQAGRALSLLDDFERRFPGSKVAEEAAVLRIETLGALGRVSEANAMGLRFLRDRPGSVYGARVRAVTQLAAQGR